ncbi:MAG: NAD(P)/FAD-dependent oxidoreductase [Anaerolineae bacterium]
MMTVIMGRTNENPVRLTDGAQVAVIGGGPAGCFFALHLLRYARQAGLRVQVTLFEARDFSRAGPPGCGKGAGLLSFGLQRELESFGLSLPEAVIQSKIDSYALHLADKRIEIFSPAPERKIVTVHRGRGPRLAPLGHKASFDAWLVQAVEQAGGRIVRAVVQKLTAAERPVVTARNREYGFDLVVLANGLNSRRVSLSGFNYRPPQTETMIQDEIDRLPGDNRQAHIYFGPLEGLVFGAMVPKGDVTSVSLLGHKLGLEAVKHFAPDSAGQSYRQLCGCKPRIAASMAGNYYADRFVAVGDAAATRLYKDGIGSAFQTGRRAAYVAVHHGISAADFERHYAPLCRTIALDNFFGRLLFYAWNIAGRIPVLSWLWLQALAHEATQTNNARRCRRALWNMFTGDDSYRRIFFSLIDPRVPWFLLTVAWRFGVGRYLYQQAER